MLHETLALAPSFFLAHSIKEAVPFFPTLSVDQVRQLVRHCLLQASRRGAACCRQTGEGDD